MPAGFDKCVKAGGDVRRVVGPDKKHGLKKGEYLNYCYNRKSGESFRGDVNKVKKASDFKLKTIMPLVELGKTFAKKAISELEVMTEGHWTHPQYGVIAVTPEDLEQFVRSFNSKVRKVDIAVDQDHQPEKGAAGWFKELKNVYEDGKSKLKAIVEWTPIGQELITGGIFKYFSPEFEFEYEDHETQETFENVLLGGALTNRPYFKSLAPVQLSENIFAGFELSEGGDNKEMTKEELKAKLAENPEFVLGDDATDEDKAAFDEAKREIEDEAKDTAGDDDKGGDDGEGNDDTKDDADKGDGDGGNDDAANRVEAVEKRHAKEMNELKSQLGVVNAKLRFTEVKEEVQGYTFSESNVGGKILPKSAEATQKLLMSMSAKQTKLFHEFLDSLPKISTKIFEEVGGDDGTSTKASEKLVEKAEALQKENEGMTFSEAMKKVSADNPELVKKADEVA